MFIGISSTFSDTGNSKDRHTKQNHDPKYTPFPRGKIGQLMFLNEAEDDDLSKKHYCIVMWLWIGKILWRHIVASFST